MSPSEALAAGTTGIVAVTGYLFVIDGEARLCELIAESFPPQCGGPNVSVQNHEQLAIGPLETEQGISWSNEPVTLFGQMSDGVLIGDPNAAG